MHAKTDEEIELKGSFVETVRRLPNYRPRRDFASRPCWPWCARASISLNPDEVGVFRVPLSFLMAPGNHIRDKRMVDRLDRHSIACPVKRG